MATPAPSSRPRKAPYTHSPAKPREIAIMTSRLDPPTRPAGRRRQVTEGGGPPVTYVITAPCIDVKDKTCAAPRSR